MTKQSGTEPPHFSAADWVAVRRICEDGFWDNRSLRSTWRVRLWLVVGVAGIVTFQTGIAHWAALLITVAAVGRVSWRDGHQEGYDCGFSEGFERGWVAASGVDWTREDYWTQNDENLYHWTQDDENDGD